MTTLLDYHHSPHRKATNGKPGEGGNHSGKDGQDLRSCPCPAATVVLDRAGNVLADLLGQGTSYVAAQGAPGWPRQRGAGLRTAQGARLRAARRARRPPGHPAGAEDRRRRGAGRLPERRRVPR
ncbi:hypothetical protein LV779_28245 [Streptomyces thinghirensis]|nr:hypothetical protein [Streptomyces thinghirensis]